MSHRLVGLCTALLVGGVLVAACGGGGSGTTTTTKKKSSTTAATTTSSSTATKVASQTTSTSLPSTVAAAVADCKKGISASTTLSASEKAKLLAVCQDFASGNIASAKAAYVKACQAEVKAAVPAAERSIALQTCQDFASSIGSSTVPTSTTPSSTGLSGVTSAVLLLACKEYEGPVGALLPASVKSELESACAQIKAGNVSAAEPALKKVCEAYAQIAPASDRAQIVAGCKEL